MKAFHMQRGKDRRWSTETQFKHIRELINYWLGVAALNRFTKKRMEMDVQWSGPIPNGPKIFAVNHPTTTDPFHMLSVLPERTRIMVNADIFKKFLIGRLIRTSGHIPVDKKAGRNALDMGIQALENGENIGIFPEGALSDLEYGIAVNPLKTGAVRMALQTGAPLVPVGLYLPINGIMFKHLEVGGERVESRFYLKGRYGITFGQPMWLNGDVEDRELVHRCAEDLRNKIYFLSRISAIRLKNAVALSQEKKKKKKKSAAVETGL